MGTMSASDAAPLPRLGEVFFDVRGNSRSMRLSWYADTGVAVFSIWQGGMCTGTFRLAIADLPRMVETLQRGPGGQQAAWDGDAPGAAFAGGPGLAGGPGEGTSYMPTMGPVPGRVPADFRGEQPDYPTGARDYPGEAPADPAPRRDDYPADLPGHPAQHGDYLADPPRDRAPHGDYLADPPRERGGPPEYLGGWPGEPDAPQPAPPGYPAERPGQAARVPDYLAAPQGQPARPAEQRTEYLVDLPAAGRADPPGFGGPFPPGDHSGVSYAGAAETAAYPQESARRGGYPAEHDIDPYLGGTNPTQYESPAQHYQPGSSEPPRGDALGATTADYPGHYGAAVADDIGDERPGDSLPYGRHRDGR